MKVPLPLPVKGIHRGFSVDKVEQIFTDSCSNVWPTDAGEGRVRLSKRPGLDKWSVTQVGGVEQPVVRLIVASFNG